MGIIRVIIAEAQVDLCQNISSYLNGKENISVMGYANDGNTAFDLIDRLRPDIAVMAIILPNLDGLAVMEKCLSQNINTKFILISDIKDPLITKEAFNLGAAYFLLKPIDLEVLTRRIKFIYQSYVNKSGAKPLQLKISNETNDFTTYRKENIDVRSETTKILYEFGIPAHLSGFHYLREAVIMSVYSNESINRVTKFIYPGLAKKFTSNAEKIERAIRHAILHAWRTNINTHPSWQSIKPTNSQFIAWAAEKVRLILKSNNM